MYVSAIVRWLSCTDSKSARNRLHDWPHGMSMAPRTQSRYATSICVKIEGRRGSALFGRTQAMTIVFSYLEVPPLGSPAAVEAFFENPLAEWDQDSRIVLVTPFWPGRVLGLRWISHLERVVNAIVASSGQRPILAEVPVALALQLREIHPASWLQNVDGVIDQLFMGAAQLTASERRRLCDELEMRAENWTSARLQALNVISVGHFALPSQRHTDTNVRFADLEWVTGGEGIREYLTARCARRLAPYRPDAIVYWADRTQTTMPHLVDDVGRKLSALRCPVALLRVRGTYADLERGIGSVQGRIAVLTDSMESGRLARSLADLANQRGGSAEVTGTFVRLSSAPDQKSFRVNPNTDLIALSTVNARGWDQTKCPLCRRGVELTVVNTESRSVPQSFAPHAYQPPRAMYWSSVILGGQAGLETRIHDDRHLHGTYVQPGLDFQLLAPLIEKIAQELVALRVTGILFHATPTSRAVIDTLGVIIDDPEMHFYPAMRNYGAWKFPSSVPSGANERLAFLDDGANTGQSIQDALVQLGMSGSRVVAAVIVEDKLPEIRHKALEILCQPGGAFAEEVRLFFVHRSPEATLSSIDGRCKACELAWLHGLLGGAANPPAFARHAHDDLRSESVSPGSRAQLTKQGRAVVSIDPNMGPAEEMNALLVHHSPEDLNANIPLMDMIVRDYLPELRSSGFAAQLDLLEPQWLARVFTWADPKDFAECDLPDDARLNLALAIQDLRHATDSAAFALRLSEALTHIDRDPSLGEEVYRDVLEHACIALLATGTPEFWLQAALRTGRHANSEPTQALLADFQLLAKRVVSAPRLGVVNAFYASADKLSENPTGSVISRMLRTPAVIDLRGPIPHAILNAEVTELDLRTAATWALAVIDTHLFTTGASDLYQRVFAAEFQSESNGLATARARRKFFQRIWRTLPEAPGMPLYARKQKRGAQDQFALLRTDVPCAVLWNNDGRGLGQMLNERARKRERSISRSS